MMENSQNIRNCESNGPLKTQMSHFNTIRLLSRDVFFLKKNQVNQQKTSSVAEHKIQGFNICKINI